MCSSDLKGLNGGEFRAVFIRAPWVSKLGKAVEVLAEIDGHAVAVREKNVLATAFHPELTHDFRIHKFFVDEICSK